jgi:hypothetical protein
MGGTDERRGRLDGELLALARRHPRETWATRADLGDVARFWLQRHAMFRHLDEIIRQGVEGALADRTEAAAFRPWLARHLGFALGQLEEHHAVEDHHYFPAFRRAEPRLASGFELLDRDHGAIHAAIADLATRAGAVLNAEPVAFRTVLGRLRDAHAGHARTLLRHLDDEEDLVIPLLLERGEHAVLGGG